MEKQTKNWWVFEYSDLATHSKYINSPINEKGEKIFYGTLDESFDFIQGLKIFNFYLQNKNINYFYCERGELIFCLPESPCDFIKRHFTLNARCLKNNGTFDLKKQEIFIKKFDENIHLRRKGLN